MLKTITRYEGKCFGLELWSNFLSVGLWCLPKKQVSVTYSYACRNIVNTIITNETHFFRKTYLSLYSKGLRKGYCVRGELETEQSCNILIPSSSCYNSTSFSFSWAAQPEALRAQPLLGPGSHYFELQQLTPNSDLQLTRTSCSTGLYNCFTSTCFSERCICTQFNPSTVKVIPWYLRPDAPVIYTGAFLI